MTKRPTPKGTPDAGNLITALTGSGMPIREAVRDTVAQGFPWEDVARGLSIPFKEEWQVLAEALSELITHAMADRDGAGKMWNLAWNAGLHPLSIPLHDPGCATSAHWILDGDVDPMDRGILWTGLRSILAGGRPSPHGMFVANPHHFGLRLAPDASMHWPATSSNDLDQFQTHNSAVDALLIAIIQTGKVLAIRGDLISIRQIYSSAGPARNLRDLINTGTTAELKVQIDTASISYPLWRLPEGLVVGGDLLIPAAPLARLPHNLWVGGNLNARASNLHAIGRGTRVGGTLDLRDCTNWDGILPDDLSVKGRILT